MLTVYPSMSIDQLDEFLLELEEHDKLIQAGVAATGLAADYALVWEYGNVRQTQKGPKTVLGINPDGKNVWLSSQAPRGWIAINENQYWDILKQELGKVKFTGITARDVTDELEDAAVKAAKRIVKILAANAPVDTGYLSQHIVIVPPDDPLLDKDEEEDTERTLLIGSFED